VGAIITLALNFLLIPTMSYGQFHMTIAAYGSMMSIPTIWGTNIPYDLKENRGYLSHPYFSAVSFYGSERIIMLNRF
jgi:hypothetical protein